MKNMKMAALLLAGSFFLGGCGGGKVRKGVVVNGVDVGGMSYPEAAERVRKTLPDLPLTLHTPTGDIACELDYADDAEEILHRARRGNYAVTQRREWIHAEEFLDMVCRNHVKAPKDAALLFDKTGFTYVPEESGTACRYHALLADVYAALRTGGTEVTLPVEEVTAPLTVEDLKARTQPLASFSTRYDASNKPRSHNLALAASRIAGTVVESGATFSFNETVGKRTRENGFLEAPVIYEGEFVSGVGGGVCQASTTLFGAALRAGLDIAESNPHSLSVGYVAPSQDAMVSEYSDLKFVNGREFPIYILASAEDGIITFTLYGLPDGYRYEVESRVLYRVEPPPAKIVEGERNRTVRKEKAGLASESYLVVYDGDEEISRSLIRRDSYQCVQGIEERAPMPATPDEILSEEASPEP